VPLSRAVARTCVATSPADRTARSSPAATDAPSVEARATAAGDLVPASGAGANDLAPRATAQLRDRLVPVDQGLAPRAGGPAASLDRLDDGLRPDGRGAAEGSTRGG
jgi:hypothetical protein